MFGRKDMEEGEPTQTQGETSSPAQTSPRAAMPAEPTRVLAPAAAPHPRRTPEVPHARRTPPIDRDRIGNEVGERKLTVGKGLSLAGEITACDVLVVEGKVEAKLADGKLIEITETGQFRGSVEIENADIAGRYDGDLTVHGRLTIRGTGRVTGIIKYGELEVSAGGQIIGEMSVVGGGAAASAGGPAYKSSAKYAAQSAQQDDEDDGALFSRKTASGG